MTGGADKTLKVWDFERDECVSTLRCGDAATDPLAFSAPLAAAAGGGLLYSGDRSGRILVWDPRDGRGPAGVVGAAALSGSGAAHGAQVCQLRYHQARDELLSGSFDCVAKSWRAPHAPRGDPPHRVFDAASADAAASDAPRRPSLMLGSGEAKPYRVFRGHKHIIRGLALGNSGDALGALVSCSVNKTVRVEPRGRRQPRDAHPPWVGELCRRVG